MREGKERAPMMDLGGNLERRGKERKKKVDHGVEEERSGMVLECIRKKHNPERRGKKRVEKGGSR